MSLTFSQITTMIDDNCQTNSTTYPTAKKVVDINNALDKVLSLIFRSDGRWTFDDSNFEDYPIITTNLVAGRREYSFTTDETGNLILDVYKVMAKSSATGGYIELYPVAQQRPASLPIGDNNIAAGVPPMTMVDGNNSQGTPRCYAKTGNGLFLDLIPSYNATAGLKVYINREGSYFTTSDTNKKPGYAGLFHEYLALRPSYQFAYRKGLSNANALQAEMLRMEQEIIKYYGGREKDTRRRFATRIESDK
jgi:hypothetical protein